MLVDTDNTTINKMNIPIELALGIRLLLKGCEQLLPQSNGSASGKIALKRVHLRVGGVQGIVQAIRPNANRLHLHQ